MKKTLFIALLIASISQLKAQDTLTVAQQITSSFSSYNLIVELNNKPQPLSARDSAARVRNINHLKYMLAKPWFYNALTTQQRSQLTGIVD